MTNGLGDAFSGCVQPTGYDERKLLSYMKIWILSPLWGHEQMNMADYLDKIRLAGYDGIDTWIPQDEKTKKTLYDYISKHEMLIVTHQHEAEGGDFTAFKDSFRKNLFRCAEPGPVLINSHTGRDYFSIEQHLELLDIASEFSERTGIKVAHETHRGRLGYSPQMTAELFKARKNISITADFSHWVCVTESMLEHFAPTLDEAILRTRHIHARVGYEQGPQVPHPGAPEWKYALDHFLSWWDRIVKVNEEKGERMLTITTEFGPKPYMPSIPFQNTPVVDQFSVNLFMKDLLISRYASYR